MIDHSPRSTARHLRALLWASALWSGAPASGWAGPWFPWGAEVSLGILGLDGEKLVVSFGESCLGMCVFRWCRLCFRIRPPNHMIARRIGSRIPHTVMEMLYCIRIKIILCNYNDSCTAWNHHYQHQFVLAATQHSSLNHHWLLLPSMISDPYEVVSTITIPYHSTPPPLCPHHGDQHVLPTSR